MCTTGEFNVDYESVVCTEFKHYEQLVELITNIKSKINDLRNEELLENKFIQIFNFYQEQPHLMDAYLSNLLNCCLNVIKSSLKEPKLMHFTFRILYLIIKTRGYKTIIRLMPHSVDDVELTMRLLIEQDINNSETRYVLLLWFSILMMLPFNLESLNIFDDLSMIDCILVQCKRFLNLDERTQEAASFLLARLITRPDAKCYLQSVITWTLDNLFITECFSIQERLKICGLLRILTKVCKMGQRLELQPYAVQVLKCVLQLGDDCSKDILILRLKAKLIQRIGLLFCPLSKNLWKYERGFRSLKENLDSRTLNTCTNFDENCENLLTDQNLIESSEMSNLDDVAAVIDYLISSLSNQYTVVRWSAAKGIGRLCVRLSRSMVDDVLTAILSLCTKYEQYTSWHGSCLALAELGRRSLLLPAKLPEVIPIVLRALMYDERSGDHNYGVNVRDAACYVCWAFARAFHPSDFASYAILAANSLILVSLFDREVNVRRAGAAAFQENVGRQGQFPHGIEILTICDYFTVGNRSQCYLELCESVAKFSDYVQPMIDHLVDIRLGHWDEDVRILASKALNRLCQFDVSYVQKEVLGKLIKLSTASTLNTQQGCIFGVAEIILALGIYKVDADHIAGIKEIVPILLKNNKFRGFSGELMRKAVCRLIETISLVKLPYYGDTVLEIWLNFLDDCVNHKTVDVQKGSVNAYSAFLSTYLYSIDGDLQLEFQEAIYQKFVTQLNSNSETTLSGYLQIIGASPVELYREHVVELVRLICDICRISSKFKNWINARVCGLKALSKIPVNMGPTHSAMNDQLLESIYPVFMSSLSDYTVDSRGDVGSHIRETGMECLQTFVQFLVTTHFKHLIVPDFIEELMTNIAQQAMEKIDRTRLVAGQVFMGLLYHEPPVPHIPCESNLMQIFPKLMCDDVFWNSANLLIPRFIQLLDFPQYRYRIILGLVVSIGGLTESTIRTSTEALGDYLLKHESDHAFVIDFMSIVVQIFEKYAQDDRIFLPMLKFLDFLLTDPVISEKMEDKNSILLDLIQLTWNEVKLSRDVHRIKAAINVFGGMLQFEGSVRSRSLSLFMISLGHRFPVIRKSAATKLYECLTIYEMIDEKSMNSAVNLLIETIWESELIVVRPIRNDLCKLFGLSIPVVTSAKTKAGDAEP